MTQAGWYPDPAGQPQTYRYWDGTSWSQETTSNPYAPPPAPAGPPVPPVPPPPPTGPPQTVLAGGPTPPPSYGQPPPAFGGGYPPSPATGSRGSGLTILLVVVAVLALLGLSVGGFFGYRALTDDDGDTGASDERSASDTATSDPTETTGPTESTEPTGPTDSGTTPTESATPGVETTVQQCTGGRPQPTDEPEEGTRRVSGGGLTIPVPDGYAPDTSYSEQFTFADDFTPLQKVIEQNDQSGWVSIYGVGALRKSNGYTDPEQAAEVVMSCMAQSTSLYNLFTGRVDLSAGEITIDGNEAYQVTAELRVDDPALDVEGDVAQVVVVDMGDAETFGLYVTVVPIGDQALIDQQEALVDRIRAD